MRREYGDSYLSAYIAEYLREAASMSFRELCQRQPAPVASAAFGAAGLAYMFLHAYEAGRGRRYLELARRWSATAWRARHRPDAFAGVGALGIPFSPPPRSFTFGLAGVCFVDARVAHASGASRRRNARITELLGSYELTAETPSDFMEGAAGLLVGIAHLARDGDPDGTLRRAGDDLARWLSIATPPSYGPWFAYGAAGHYYALLRWSLATGYVVPTSSLDAFRAIAPTSYGDDALGCTWCNGAAGMAIAFATAFAVTRDASDLSRAEAAALHLETDISASNDLCCGLAGRAHALLAIDRITSTSHHRARARDLAIAAVASPPQKWPNSLLRGHPGLVCLAIDLVAKREPRFPFVDG